MPRRPSLLIYGALALSVAVNLAGAGYLFASDDRDRPQRRTVEDTIDFISKRYPDAVGDAVKAQLESRREQLGAALAEMKTARRAAREAIGADPVDRSVIESAFAASREKSSNFQKVIHDAIADAAPSVALDDRQKVARGERD